MRRRIVEFHRGRDLYFRKHRMPVSRALWRVCWTWAYLVRAAAATVLPGHSPRRYLATRASSSTRRTARACARSPRSTTAAAPTAWPSH